MFEANGLPKQAYMLISISQSTSTDQNEYENRTNSIFGEVDLLS